MRVKICGITTLNDALHAINAGADALGFVFYKHSARYISPEDAYTIISQLPPFIEKVGLFVNETSQNINHISKQSAITLVQLHFECDAALTDGLDLPFLHVVRASKPKEVHNYDESYRLVDAYCEGYGGMGKRINLEWFNGVDCSKIILAGGLSPENIHEALRYNFYAVDVSSGVEKTKGVKDHHKVSSFISQVKAC